MYSKTVLIGRTTRTPELKTTPKGTSVATVGFATTHGYKDKQETEFHNLEFWGKSADSVAAHVKKGSAIVVEGRLRTDSWEKDGHKNYKTKVVVEHWAFCPTNARKDADDSAPMADVPDVEVPF